MAKTTKHFELSIPNTVFTGNRHICIGHVEVSGVAYSWDDEDEPYTYDIDEIFYRNRQGELRKVDTDMLQFFGVEPKECDDLHNPIMAHIPGLFREPQEEDPTDNIEFSHTFDAIATICEGYNNTLIVNPTKPAA